MNEIVVHICKECKHSKEKEVEEIKVTYEALFCDIYRNRVSGSELQCSYIRTKSDSNTCEGYEANDLKHCIKPD